jgi:long-subunit fatty acid transport protein
MKKIIFIFLFLFSHLALASYPELFGASYSTSSIANQSNLDINDPSNNYYAPALLGFSDKVNMLYQLNSVSTGFTPIKNIVITNNTNSNAQTYGDVSNNYENFNGGALHFALPIGYQHIGTLGLSVYMPLGSLMETNSGDPFRPEYVMYQSRYQHTSAYLNFAKSFLNDYSISIGSYLGFQASANVNTNINLGIGATYGSWASARSKISPSLALIASFAKKYDHNKFYFTYQQEMKSNLKATVNGEITDPARFLLNTEINSMIFYDPHTFRFGFSQNYKDLEIYTGIEYQLWSNYIPPKINIIKTGGVIYSSTNFENLVIRNTFNPRIGLKYSLTSRFDLSAGLGYRMTPIDGNFSGSGNSIDANTTIFSTGFQYRIVIWSRDVSIGSSFQYQLLEKNHVIKTTLQEDGSIGNKIGSGPNGYDIAGHVIAGSAGIKFNF